MDHLLSGNLAACGDALLQRFKAVELAGKAGWAVASRMELIPQSAVSAVPSEEREAALTLESRERRQLIVEAGHCSLMPYSSRSRDRRRKRVRHRWLLWGGGASQARALCLPRFRCPQREQAAKESRTD